MRNSLLTCTTNASCMSAGALGCVLVLPVVIKRASPSALFYVDVLAAALALMCLLFSVLLLYAGRCLFQTALLQSCRRLRQPETVVGPRCSLSLLCLHLGSLPTRHRLIAAGLIRKIKHSCMMRLCCMASVVCMVGLHIPAAVPTLRKACFTCSYCVVCLIIYCVAADAGAKKRK